jgi:16S rRNA (cytidine1402-2'-O)-methyltransferase
MILYVSPHKLVKTLAEFITYFGEDRPICVSRELSKLHEENVRGTTREVLTHFEKTAPRGEIVVVVGGKPIVKEAKKRKFEKDEAEETAEI